jgi:hypothetical protein
MYHLLPPHTQQLDTPPALPRSLVRHHQPTLLSITSSVCVGVRVTQLHYTLPLRPTTLPASIYSPTNHHLLPVAPTHDMWRPHASTSTPRTATLPTASKRRTDLPECMYGRWVGMAWRLLLSTRSASHPPPSLAITHRIHEKSTVQFVTTNEDDNDDIMLLLECGQQSRTSSITDRPRSSACIILKEEDGGVAGGLARVAALAVLGAFPVRVAPVVHTQLLAEKPTAVQIESD